MSAPTRGDELPGFEARLLTALRGLVEARTQAAPVATPAAGRGHGLARRWALVGALVATAALLATAPGLISRDAIPRLGDRAFAVQQRSDGSLRVTVVEHLDDPWGLQEALRRRGVAVAITRVPGSPSTVGRLSHLFVPEDAEGIEVLRSSPGHVWDFIVDPQVFAGAITLEVAEAARPGQRMMAVGEAFAPGEPLEGLPCAVGWPVDSAELERAAGRAGMGVAWHLVSGFDGDGGWSARPAATRPDGPVFTAHLQEPASLHVEVLPEGVRPRGSSGSSWADPEARTAGCTPEQAGRWR